MQPSVELKSQIEELALRLVVEDTSALPSAWIAALERIRKSAERDRAQDVAEAAGVMLEAVRQAPSSVADAELLDEMQNGILRLQNAIEKAGAAPARPSEELLPAQDPELLGDFVLESREHLVNIESQALTIERDPFDAEALNSVFRGFHTIKGLAGFMELWEVQELAHEVETVLDRARNAQLTITPPVVDLILQGADYLRRWMTHLDSKLHDHPSEAPLKDEGLLARVRAIVTSQPPEAAPTPKPEDVPAPPRPNEASVEKPDSPESAGGSVPLKNESRTVKVDTAKLDYLVDMAGEMVIAESLVRHDPDLAGGKNPSLQRKIGQLTRITAELQKTAMAMRLVPIGPLFHRMARLVRDLARQFGKEVALETVGDDVELDRTIVEELADPLMHMVRNALDHGIESPLERQSAGKSPESRLVLKAHHQAGQVVIEIADDGRGLDRKKIGAKAVERGLIASVDALSDSEVHGLIFLPGFSTADRVTNVSGRGVGMDVVRKHIERLRGRVEIRSTAGQGSTFLLKLPLTLAIIDGLVVGVGTERYIVPLFAVREMFRPSAETLWTVRQRCEMALVRDTLVPVHRLYRRFRVVPKSEDPLQSVLVVAEVEGQRFCLMVDELIGKQEVVIKTLGETFRGVSGVAGGAILGDGRVGLILDLDHLFKEKTNEP